MQDKSDAHLLRDYAERRDEAAFRELVTRHADFVYAAALRQVESSAAACDIAQGVFTDLARKARSLVERTGGDRSLAGWLHRATRFAALNHFRDDRRRRDNERQAMEQLLTNSESAADWEQIRPALDEALDSLGDEDREALLLRYFKNQDFRAVGLALGVSDDAAQKRVSRALEKLREFFSKRKIAVGAGGLGILISTNAVQSAPAGLEATISAAALAGTAVSTSTITAATAKTIAMTTLQKTLVTATLAVVAGAGIYEARHAAHLREQNQALQQRQAPLAEQVRQLQASFAESTNKLADLLAENSRLQSNSNQNEILKLRGEVTRLQNQLQASQPVAASVETAAKAWLRNVDQLKSKFEEHPERKIPELAFAADYDWLQNMRYDFDAAKAFDEQTWRSRMAELRLTAKDTFAHRLGDALDNFIAAHVGNLPTSLSELNQYYRAYGGEPKTMDDSILQRYELVQSGNLRDITDLNTPIIVEKAPPADEDYDTKFKLGVVMATYEGIGLWTSNRQGSCAFNNFNKVINFKAQ